MSKSLSRKQLMCYLIFFLCVVGIVTLQIYFLTANEYGDEYETIVVCKMMASGSHLYENVFNHHGPLTFLFGFLLEVIGNFGVAGHRIPIILLQWITFACIFTSPLLKKSPYKYLVTAFVAVGILGVLSLYPILGNMYLYQNIAGLFIIIINAQLIFPLLLSQKPSKHAVMWCQFLNACLPFLAITYAPFSLFIFLYTFKKEFFKEIFKGCLAAVVLTLLFLVCFGSIKGYIAYHIYCNLYILAPGASMWNMLVSAITQYFLKAPDGIVSLVVTLGLIIWLSLREQKHFYLRPLFLCFAPLLLALRGTGLIFHALPFWMCLLSFSIAYAHLWSAHWAARAATAKLRFVLTKPIALALSFIAILGVCLEVFFFPLVPYTPIQTQSAFGNLAKILTEKDDTILALPFDNQQYLFSDRLPASTHFFYLPWQSYYNAAPILGVYTNLAEDIIEKKPKLIFINQQDIWDTPAYSWSVYATDVQAVIDENYRALSDTGIYVRNDINLLHYDLSSVGLSESKPEP